MPDEKDLKGEQENAEESTPKGPGFPIKKYGMYGAIVLVVVVAAYFVTLKVVRPMLVGGDSVSETQDENAHASGDDKAGSESKSGQGSSDGETKGGIHLIEDIIVNPAGTGGRRFLSTSIGFELSTPEATSAFESREAVVRDALITILSSQSIPELSDFKQREKLRKLIQLRVEKLLDTNAIAAVYFTEFVLQ